MRGRSSGARGKSLRGGPAAHPAVVCPDPIELERLLTGETGADERARLETHVAGCTTCAGRLADAREDAALARRLRAAVGDAPLDVDAAELLGAVDPALARYRVLRRIGAGGMGVVFEAEQRNPERRIALKVLRQTHPSDHALRRFAFEAEVLARLDHPGVARIHEAGTFETARGPEPFFAMELVRGAPLDRWAAEGRPDRARRLAVFLAVCDAVEHAHRSGVIHRDLKPANVLVDDEDRPKVLDFGVARAVAGAGPGGGATAAGELVGTLSAMSPEQMAGDPEAVDTRTDVYSLGLMLYELLVGRPPRDLAGKTAAQARREVAGAPPPSAAAAAPGLPRDLDTIVARALAVDPDERYGSVAALAADLRRFQRSEPIEARRTGAWERARLFVRRHRAGSAAAAALALALVGGVAATAHQSVRARAAERLAVEEAARSADVVRFFRALLGGDDLTGRSRPADFSLRAALDEAGERLDGALAEDPAVAAQLHVTLGSAYSTLGLADRAEPHLDAALELRRRRFGPRSVPVAEALNARAVAAVRADDTELAIELLEEALAIYGRELPPLDPRAAAARANLGTARVSAGDLLAGRALLERALAEFERGSAAGSPSHAAAHAGLAAASGREGRSAEARDHAGHAVAMLRAAVGPEHPETASATVLLACALLDLGRVAEALPLATGARDALAAAYGPEHADAADAAAAAQRARDAAWQQSVELFERAEHAGHPNDAARDHDAALGLALALARGGDERWPAGLPKLRSALAMALADLARFAEAEAHLRAALEDARDDARRTALLINLAAVRHWRGDARGARALLEEVLAVRRAGGDELGAATARNNLTHVLLDLGECAAAEEHARAALATWSEHLGEAHPHTAVARRNLAAVLLARDRPDEARHELGRALPVLLAAPRRAGRALAVTARCLEAAGDDAAAHDALAEARARLLAIHPPTHPALRDTE